MARKKSKGGAPFFSVYSGYGWTDMGVKRFTGTMQVVTKKVAQLQEELGFTALAFTGSSGSAAAFILSVALQIPLIYVRKEGERSHGGEIEGNAWDPVQKYLIVDDFIDRGDTVRRIHSQIVKRAARNGQQAPECVGIFLYAAMGNTGKVTMDDGSRVPIFK